MFQQFERGPVEKGARKRTAASLTAAVAVYVGVGAGVVYLATGGEKPVREKELEVTFAPAPPVRAEAPKAAPQPRPVVKKLRRAAARVAKRAPLAPPKELPRDPPKEADAALLGEVTMGQDDLEERGEAAAATAGPPAVAEADEGERGTGVPRELEEEPPPPPPVKEPVYLPERAIPPRPAEDNPLPRFPAGKRKAGDRHLVVIKVVIKEDGGVDVVKVLRGEAPYVAAVLAVLPRWRFQPAEFEGERIRVFKILEIPFVVRG